MLLDDGREVTISKFPTHNCPDCTHKRATTNLVLSFAVAATTFRELPTKEEVIEALLDGLPSEWFRIDTGSEWWVNAIK